MSAMKFPKSLLEFNRSMDGEWELEVNLDYYLKPEKIIYNGPMCIVIWKDGTKTKVRRSSSSNYNPYNAFTAALAKKVYGTNSRVNRMVNKAFEEAVVNGNMKGYILVKAKENDDE